MVMNGGAQLTLVIEARDLASQRLKQAGEQVGYLEGQVKRAGMSFTRFTTILGAAGISAYALVNVIKMQFEDMEKTNRAATTLTSQFRFMGFSAEDAAGSVRNLRNNLNSAAFQALPGMDEAMKSFLANIDPDTAKRMDQLSEELSVLFGVDKQTAIKAVAEALAGNVTELNKITGSMASLADQVAMLDQRWKEYNENLTESQRLWKDFGDAAPKAIGNFMVTLGKMFDQALAFPHDFPNIVMDGLGNLGNMIGSWFERDSPAIQQESYNTGKLMGAEMSGGTMTAVQSLGSMFQIGQLLSPAVPEALEFGQNLGGTLVTGITQGWTAVSEWFSDTFLAFFTDKLPGFLSFVAEQFKNVGVGIVTGIWTGITSMAEWLFNLVKNFAINIFNKIKEGLGALNPFGAPSDTTPAPGATQSAPNVQSASPSAFNGRSAMSSSQIIPITLQVGQNAFGKAVLEVVDGHIRLQEPGLGLR